MVAVVASTHVDVQNAAPSCTLVRRSRSRAARHAIIRHMPGVLHVCGAVRCGVTRETCSAASPHSCRQSTAATLPARGLIRSSRLAKPSSSHPRILPCLERACVDGLSWGRTATYIHALFCSATCSRKGCKDGSQGRDKSCYSRRALVVGSTVDGWAGGGSCLRQSASMSREVVPRLTKRVIRARVFSAAEEPRWAAISISTLGRPFVSPTHPAASTSQRHWPIQRKRRCVFLSCTQPGQSRAPSCLCWAASGEINEIVLCLALPQGPP